MESLIYLYVRSFKNRLIKALHKPVTYIYLILGIAYACLIIFGVGTMFEEWNMASPEGFALLLSGMTCFFLPTNIVTYAKRKGLLFRPSDVHFVFTSPVSPKLVLLYAQVKQYLLNLLMVLLLVIAGIALFHIPVWKMLVYFLLSFVVENILETSLMVCLYGNERLSEKTVRLLCRLLYLVLAALVLFGGYLYFFEVKSLSVITVFLEHPVLQCIPIVGWNIAFIRMLILGPTTLNVICTALYCISAAGLLFAARKMQCTGGYYEDAMKFADDYQEARNRQKKGEAAKLWKKEKYRRAKVTYKGYYSKAIFYRQLLEYKKKRFFIFGGTTLACLIVGVAVGYMAFTETGMDLQMKQFFLVPIASAYVTFIFSGYLTKWAKEMESPYTYLIPDKPIRKLWYATLIEHIRSAADGLLVTLPAALVLGLPLGYILLNVLFYVCLQANKLYFSVLSESLLGNVLGNTGKTILRMVGQMIVITIAVVIAAVVTIAVNFTAGFLAMCLYMLVMAALVALGGSVAFAKMETV